jgi:prepilin-type processing-associated H-X9-DG protein/prepilin-type N-terminal cleavage/methylation domain-containing protein
MKRLRLFIWAALAGARSLAGPFDPAAGQPGSNAVASDDPRIVAWGSAVGKLDRGLQDASEPDLGNVTYGLPAWATGPADAEGDSFPVVSLGDGGWIEMLFGFPITDGPGPDFAVFENGITDTFLELAFVEVSNDGASYVRFPAVSLTPSNSQVDPFGALDATNLHDLAGKYRRGFGTPFDLSELAPLAPSLDITHITHVRIVDVVGSIDPRYATYDASQPTPNIVNDPWPTPFETGGFDLDAIAVLHQIPEPRAIGLLVGGWLCLAAARRRRKHPIDRCRKFGRTTSGGAGAAHGFTVVELLVVLAILCVLITMIFAGLHTARERGDAAQCAANLRQLALANVTYAAEHDGQYVAAQEPTNTIRWHGARHGVKDKFDPTRGPLAPYLGRDGKVKMCPALREALTGGETFEDGTGGYGYNAIYVGGTPADRYTAARISHVPRASRTVMFTDTAFPKENGLQEYAYCEPWEWVDVLGRLRGRLSPSVHFRHGDHANVAWCDGHVTAEWAAEYGGVNQYRGDATRAKIGWFGPREDNGYWKP